MSETGRKRILNVDDDDGGRYATTRILMRSGFEVIEAATGMEGLRLVKERPDLVLLDVNLPDMNGFEVCRRIKTDPDTASIPVLHLSATLVESGARVKGLNEGADGYLVHPITPGELVATVKALLRTKEAEERARIEADYWRSTFDAIRDAVCLLDPQGKILRHNLAFEKLAGRSGNEIRGHFCYGIVHDSDDFLEDCPVVRARESGERAELEMQVGDRWFLITVDPVFDENGILSRLVHVMVDITRRRLTEDALHSSESFLNSVVDQSPYPMWISDHLGTLIRTNRALRDLLHISDEEVVGKYNLLKDNIVEEQGALPLLKTVFDNGETVRFQLKYDSSKLKNIQLKHAVFVILDVTVFPIRDSGGKITNAVIQHVDITERKKAEEEKLRLLERLGAQWEITVMAESGTKAVCDVLLKAIVRLSKSKYGFYGFLSDDESIMTIHSWSDDVMKDCHFDEKPIDFPIDKSGLWGDAIRERRTIVINDYSREYANKKGLPEGHVSINRLLVVPVMSRGRIVAVGAASNKETDYTEEDARDIEELLRSSQLIWERRRAEDALRESEEVFHNFFNNSEVGMFRIRLDESVLLDVNEKFLDILGQTREAVIGKPCAIHWADPRQHKEVVHRLDADGRVVDFECKLQNKEGQVRDCLASMILYPTERIVDGSILDITERKQVQEKLEDQMEFVTTLLETIPSPVFYKDSLGHYLGVNKAFEQFLGNSRDQIIGKSVYDIAPPETASGYAEMDQELFRHPGKQMFESKVRLADGSERDVVFHKATFSDAGNKVVGLIGIILDITERLRLATELQQAQKLESVGRLAGGVAHDFNNMLGIILGCAEIALMEAGEETLLHDNLTEIRRAAARAADLTRQLLAFARKQTIAPRVLDLNATVEGMLNMLRRLIGENINLTWTPRKDLWPVRMDPAQIDQILANLCVNARDAITGVGMVTVQTENVLLDEGYCAARAGFTPGEYVMLTVSDNGCGMDEKTRRNLFEPFFTTKEMGKGTGLGLSTVYGIIKQNEGFINVYSEPGWGTTFKIFIPRHGECDVESFACESADFPPGRGETVLLVEDERGMLEMGKRLLERLGYTVLAAATPGEAMRLAGEHAGKIDLLMTDVVMPEMNGRELVERLQVNEPGLKSLFMSGYTADVIAHHGVLDEGVQFIQKPFGMKDLADKVRGVLDALG